MENGYKILDLNETYFYFIKRKFKSSQERFKNETIAEYQLYNKKFSTPSRSILSFLKKILWTNNTRYISTIVNDIRMLRTKFEIYESLKDKVTKK